MRCDGLYALSAYADGLRAAWRRGLLPPLADQVDALPAQPGVYALVHLAVGRVYVGQSVDVHGRVLAHLAALRRGAHPCAELQGDFDAFPGALAAVLVRTVTVCPEAALDAAERAAIASVDPRRRYNVLPGGRGAWRPGGRLG